MPGSLGVEAILQALEACALELEPACSWRGWRSRPAVGHQMRWKYRGQLVPGDRELRLEVHLKDVQPSARRLRVAGDASLWKGPWRIYEVRDAAIELSDG
jgi:3-hydroxymyristoyl/3-hydroxydecanoyl-(acyl carrier protein) dehydratase